MPDDENISDETTSAARAGEQSWRILVSIRSGSQSSERFAEQLSVLRTVATFDSNAMLWWTSLRGNDLEGAAKTLNTLFEVSRKYQARITVELDPKTG